MGVGAFSTESTTDVRAPNNSQTAADNAVNLRNQNSNNPKFNLKLGRGASYVVNQSAGFDLDTLKQFGSSLFAGMAGMGQPPTDPITQAATDRATEQIETAPEEAKKQPLSMWILIGAGTLVLLFAIFVKGKRA